LRSWRRHASGACTAPIIISDENVRDWIPDLPEEYFQLPGPDEKLDFIRHGLIYHHGGIVLTREVVLAKNLAGISDLIAEKDLVSSAEHKHGSGRECGDSFQSFFVGGRRGSDFHAAVWSTAKAAVTKHCPLADKKKEVICCFDEPIRCHIPGGALGESLASKVNLMLAAEDFAVDSYCFSESDSLRPAYFQYVLDHKPKLKDASRFFQDERQMELLDRAAFFLPQSDTVGKTCEQLFNPRSVVGAVYATSLNLNSSADDFVCPESR